VKWRLVLIAATVLSLGSGYNSPPQPGSAAAPPPDAGIDQRLGNQVPLDLPFTDEQGHRVRLGDCTAGKPTVLVLAYFRCPMLCSQVLNGLLGAVRANPANVGSDFNVVVVSIDPREKPPLAALKKASYVQEYGRTGGETGWHFLTGDPLAIATLADAVGFRYRYDEATEQYAHGSGLIILAPDGAITRYLFGVWFEPRDLRLALAEASAGKVGSPAAQVLLLCYRYDPATGTYTFTILRLVKWLSAAAILGIAGMLLVLIRRGRRQTREARP
jgi:protein SCO1/2